MGIVFCLYTLAAVGFTFYQFLNASFGSFIKIFCLCTVIWVVLLLLWQSSFEAKKEKRRKARQDENKKLYEEALKGTDKQKALEYGRRYYAGFYTGKAGKNSLSLYDEQSIAGDIAAMKTEV